MATLDPNTWYTLTNNYTGSSTYLYPSTSNDFLAMGTASFPLAKTWQLFLSGNVYYLRNQFKGSSLQASITSLDAYNVPMPIFKTPFSSSCDQQWTIESYSTNFRIGNVDLGNAVFLDTYANTSEPFFEPWIHSGQIWSTKSAAAINDVAFSTLAGGSAVTSSLPGTQTSTSTQAPTPTSITKTESSAATSSTGVSGSVVTVTSSPAAPGISSSSKGRLSTGTFAGIAVGATLSVVLLACLLGFCLWKRRNSSKKATLEVQAVPPPYENRMSEVPGDNKCFNGQHEATRKQHWISSDSPNVPLQPTFQQPTAELQGINLDAHGRSVMGLSELQ